MKFSGNTILITGGSSGIGLEMSKQFLEKGNKVIICGRSMDKLHSAKDLLPALEIYQCDLADQKQCEDLVRWLCENQPGINVVINNAAIVHKTDFHNTDNVVQMAELEMATNFHAPVRLIKGLFPQVQKNNNPVIINVSTGLIYAPRADYPFYNSTKAALHAFTRVLRKQSKKSGIRIIEVMFPAVKTPWHKGTPPKMAITAKEAVTDMMKGLDRGKDEIKVGKVPLLYFLSRIAPKFAFNKVNSLEDGNYTK